MTYNLTLPVCSSRSLGLLFHFIGDCDVCKLYSDSKPVGYLSWCDGLMHPAQTIQKSCKNDNYQTPRIANMRPLVLSSISFPRRVRPASRLGGDQVNAHFFI